MVQKQLMRKSKKSWMLGVGFLLFIIGMLSFVLNLVGLQLSYLSFLDQFGILISVSVKLFMVIGGLVLAFLASTNSKIV